MPHWASYARQLTQHNRQGQAILGGQIQPFRKIRHIKVYGDRLCCFLDHIILITVTKIYRLNIIFKKPFIECATPNLIDVMECFHPAHYVRCIALLGSHGALPEIMGKAWPFHSTFCHYNYACIFITKRLCHRMWSRKWHNMSPQVLMFHGIPKKMTL
jgi:hypothetical protein